MTACLIVISSLFGICYSIFSPEKFVYLEGSLRIYNPLLCLNRCFSFGIGEGASSALITGLAENGSGHAQFITGTERMQAKVRLGSSQTVTKNKQTYLVLQLNGLKS